jgi:hypothetical protein
MPQYYDRVIELMNQVRFSQMVELTNLSLEDGSIVFSSYKCGITIPAPKVKAGEHLARYILSI